MWKKLGLAAQGGSIFKIHQTKNDTWLATGAGLLHQTESGWGPIPQSQPLASIIDICADPKGKVWWAAGLSGNLVRSRNQGESWEMCWLDQVNEPIVCLAVSPRYNTDRTLLAGTSGAGILRSTDGGYRWFLSNFGLQDFTILALTPATDWSRREIIFAGTLAGVYRSSGGGRAWKQVGLADVVIQTLATSPRFTENGLVLAGSEGKGIFRSADGGKSWQSIDDGISSSSSINTLLCYEHEDQETWLAATDDNRLLRSIDDGQSWTTLLTAEHPILTLAAGPDGCLLVGLGDGGVLTSPDGGQNWSPSTPLYGRSWQRLMSDDAQLFAIAPRDGIWSSINMGKEWDRIVQASLDQPLFDMCSSNQSLLIAQPDGIWGYHGTNDARHVLPAEDAPIVALASNRTAPDTVWAAAADCQLWRSSDGGQQWQPVAGPIEDQQLMAMEISPEDSTLLICTVDEFNRKLILWRWAEDKHWEKWLRESLKQPYLQLIAKGTQAENSWFINDTDVWRYADGAWHKQKRFDRTVRRAASNATGTTLYALVGNEIFYWNGSDTWTPVELSQDISTLVDILLLPDDTLLALDIKGVLWQLS